MQLINYIKKWVNELLAFNARMWMWRKCVLLCMYLSIYSCYEREKIIWIEEKSRKWKERRNVSNAWINGFIDFVMFHMYLLMFQRLFDSRFTLLFRAFNKKNCTPAVSIPNTRFIMKFGWTYIDFPFIYSRKTNMYFHYLWYSPLYLNPSIQCKIKTFRNNA